MESTVWKAGWDGEWFRRAYDDFGHVLGSKENTEGRIFIEPQGICIMAGLGVENGNAVKALNSVAEHLATPHCIVLQQPAFSQYYLHLGEISSYPTGYKGNAGIFCHTNPWIMIAEATVGRGDKAFDYYKRINPSAREAIGDLHKCEPYVYAQMIAGKDAATHGEALILGIDWFNATCQTDILNDRLAKKVHAYDYNTFAAIEAILYKNASIAAARNILYSRDDKDYPLTVDMPDPADFSAAEKKTHVFDEECFHGWVKSEILTWDVSGTFEI